MGLRPSSSSLLVIVVLCVSCLATGVLSSPRIYSQPFATCILSRPIDDKSPEPQHEARQQQQQQSRGLDEGQVREVVREVVHKVAVAHLPAVQHYDDSLTRQEAVQHQSFPQSSSSRHQGVEYEPVAHESSRNQEEVQDEETRDDAGRELHRLEDAEAVDALDVPVADQESSEEETGTSEAPAEDMERLVPVLTFSGAPAKHLMRKFEVRPDPASVPRITRQSIEENASLTQRQKGYLSKVLDDYYRFIVSNVKNMRRRHKKK